MVEKNGINCVNELGQAQHGSAKHQLKQEREGERAARGKGEAQKSESFRESEGWLHVVCSEEDASILESDECSGNGLQPLVGVNVILVI